MRYAKEYKEEARQRLLQRGGSHAKKHGFSDSGIASLAAAAGVTTGSLYKHFDGKADFFASVVATELKRTTDMFGAIGTGDRAAAIKTNAAYLSVHHVQHPETGCALPSLTTEVARTEGLARDVFDTGARDIHVQLERILGSAQHAWELMARNIGAVMLARALNDTVACNALLDAVRVAGEKTISQCLDTRVKA